MNFFDANAHAKSKPQRHLRSIHVPRNPSVGIQASNFGRIKPPIRLRSIHVHEIQASESKLRISAASKPPSWLRRIHVHGIQASESKLRISAALNLQAGFVASTSTESKLRNPCFQFRRHRTYTPASSHPRPRNPSFQFRSLLQSMWSPHHCLPVIYICRKRWSARARPHSAESPRARFLSTRPLSLGLSASTV